MNRKKLSPEELVIDSEIDKIGNAYFSNIKIKSDKRGKAFISLCVSSICHLDIKKIDQNDITDGEDDHGIDAINIKGESGGIIVNILGCTSFGGYKPGEISKIKRGLSYIFAENISKVRKINNKKLIKKIEEIRKYQRKIKKINIYYCVYKDVEVDEKIKREIERIYTSLNPLLEVKYKNAELKFYPFTSSKILLKMIRNKNPLSKIVIDFKCDYHDKKEMFCINNEIENVRGSVITVRGQEVAELVKKFKSKVFAENIREWLGYKETNKAIIETSASEYYDKFWFLNNGITIVCSDVIVNAEDNTKLKLKYPQIVNGQQTAWSLYEVSKKKEGLNKDIKVICRIYETEDPEFVKMITRATNTQTRIDKSDLFSNDSKQVAIEKIFSQLGYFYKRKKGVKKYKKVKRSITSTALGQTSLALIHKRPSEARIPRKNKIFGEKKYDLIFNRNPIELLLTFLLWDYCKRLASKPDVTKRRNKNREIKYYGSIHIARIIWEYWENRNLLNNLNQTLEDFEKNKINLRADYKKAFNLLKKVIEKHEKKEKILNLASHLSRREIDVLLLKALSKLK